MKTSSGNALARLHIAFFRWLEGCLSPDVFYAVVWPYCLARAILNNLFKFGPAAPPVPDFLQSPRHWFARVRNRLHLYLDEVLQNFYDRLDAPKWQNRCEVVGLEHLEAARRAGRPVILVYWHLGCYPLVPGWMRRGIKYPLIPFVGGVSFKRSHLARLQDQYAIVPGIPISIHPDQLRELVKWVNGINLIYIAIDVPISKQVAVPFCEGWDYQLTSGPIRMASHFGADLIACGMTRVGPWRYRLFLSRPVPQEFLLDESDGQQAGAHLIAEMLPEFKAHPDQCMDALTQRLMRKPRCAEIKK